MSTLRLVSAALVTASLFVPNLLVPSGGAEAQTANGSPTAPASPGLVGTPRPVSRTAPSVGARGRDAHPPADGAPSAVRKPTAAERAEQRQLEHDLHICIGC